MTDKTTEPVWQWWWAEGAQPERCHGPCASREEAISEATGSDTEPDWSHFTIVEATKTPLRDDHLDAERVIEWFNDHNEEAADPDGDPVIDCTTPEQDRELEAALKAAWVAWRTKHGLGQSFMFGETRNEEVLPHPAYREEANVQP